MFFSSSLESDFCWEVLLTQNFLRLDQLFSRDQDFWHFLGGFPKICPQVFLELSSSQSSKACFFWMLFFVVFVLFFLGHVVLSFPCLYYWVSYFASNPFLFNTLACNFFQSLLIRPQQVSIMRLTWVTWATICLDRTSERQTSH